MNNLTLPETVNLPQQSALSSLLGGLGTGIQTGATAALTQLLTQQKSAAASRAPLSTSEFKGLMSIGDVGKLFPDPEQQFKIKKKLNKRISEIGKEAAIEEFGENPLEYLRDVETPAKLTPEEEEKNKFLESLGISTKKSPTKQVMDYLTGKEVSSFEKNILSAIAKKPSQIIQTPVRGFLDFIEQSMGAGAIKAPQFRGGPILPPTAAEAWREYAEKGLTEEEKEALRKGEVASVILIDAIGGLLRKAPGEGIKLAEEIIRAKKYPEPVLREIRDITNEFKARLKIPGVEVLTPEYQEELIALRKTQAEELAKRPLKEYLKEPKTYESPAMKATKARATEALVDIDKQIAQTEGNLNKVNEQLAKGIKTKKSRSIIEKAKADFESQLVDLRAKRKDLEYTERRGIEPFSYEKTLEEATAHNENIKYAYAHPKSTKASTIMKQFTRDQKYVDEAINILKRRKDVPIAPYKDLYIKKLETYNDAYRTMIDNLEEKIKSSKGTTKKKLEGLRDKFKANLNINESKLIKHREKLETKQAIKEAPIFLRKYLADLRNDIPTFKKDIIRYKEAIEGGLEEKISELAKEKLKTHYEKAFDEVFKKPTEQNIKKVVEEIKKVEEEVGIEKIDKKQFDKLSKKGKEKANSHKNFVKGLLIGSLKEFIRAKTGINVPTRGLYVFTGIGAGSAISLTNFLVNVYKRMRKQIVIRNFRKVLETKNPKIIKAYRKKLRKSGYSEMQINNLQKLAIF